MTNTRREQLEAERKTILRNLKLHFSHLNNAQKEAYLADLERIARQIAALDANEVRS